MEDWEKIWKEVIREDEFNHPDLCLSGEDPFGRLYEYWGERLPKEVLLEFRNNPKRDFILENLQTHDPERLIRALTSEYGQSLIFLRPVNQQFLIFRAHCSRDFTFLDLIQDLRSGRGKQLLDFYGYTFAGIDQDNIQIEPRYAKSALDYIRFDCKGIVWHLCPKQQASSVLRNGLRTRDRGDSLVRNYPKRIYVWAIEPEKKKELKQGLERLAKTLSGRSLSDFQVLKIFWPKTIPIYQDTAMDDSHSFYTYTNIPASLTRPVEI